MDKKYRKYLQSAQWKEKRERLFEIRGKACEVCQSTDRIEVHHKTYRSIFNEDLTHLQVLCHKCHSDKHSKPEKASPKKAEEKRPKRKKNQAKPYLVSLRKRGSVVVQSFGFYTKEEALLFIERSGIGKEATLSQQTSNHATS